MAKLYNIVLYSAIVFEKGQRGESQQTWGQNQDWRVRKREVWTPIPSLQIPPNPILGPVVQRLDNFIHWINHYPADKMHSNQYILSAG